MTADLVISRPEDLVSQSERVREINQIIYRRKQKQPKGDIFRVDKKKLAAILEEVGPFTKNTLFIGIADDGLPILLNMDDPKPGAMLFVGDEHTGKTPQLKTIAAALSVTHKAEEVRFAVLTAFPSRWQDLKDSPNLINIFASSDPGVSAFLEGLINWASVNRNTSQRILLLIDNIHRILQDIPLDARDNLMWLLRQGAQYGIWSFATLQTQDYQYNMRHWKQLFGTLVYGQIRLPHRSAPEYDIPAVGRRRGEFVLGGRRGPVLRFHTPLLTV